MGNLSAFPWPTREKQFSQEMRHALLTGASSVRSGLQPATGARGWARLHSLLDATALRARSLTSHVGESLSKEKEKQTMERRQKEEGKLKH